MRVDRETTAPSRIVSMDQFRGYTVVGMILVNFIDDFAVSHPVFAHHNTYFSYADTIMPSFHFAVGFAFRLTLLRRLAKTGRTATYFHFLRRNLGLVLLSLVLSPMGHKYESWLNLQHTGIWGALAAPLKCEFWETLAIIGVTSIWLIPVMGACFRTRFLFLIFCGLAHLFLSYWFYFDFLWARPNWLDARWGATDTRGLDGGPFGFLGWSIAQLAGSFAYDFVAGRRPWLGFLKVVTWGTALMVLGYLMSCLTMLYGDAAHHGQRALAHKDLRTPDQKRLDAEDVKDNDDEPAGSNVAPNPVWPPPTLPWGRDVHALLAEPPFVAPPHDRPINYWMMCKRATTLSFMLFSSGFAFAVYAVFILLCDLISIGALVRRLLYGHATPPADLPYQWSMLGILSNRFFGPQPLSLRNAVYLLVLRLDIFRPFGLNPLAAYIIHGMVGKAVGYFAPSDAPLYSVVGAFALYFGITYLFVRHLERNGIFLRM